MEDIKRKQKIYSTIYYGAAGIHLIYAVLFILQGVLFGGELEIALMTALNGLLMVGYIVLGTKARWAKKFYWLFISCGVAMAFHTILHMLLVGASYGYQYLFLGVIPVIFYLAYSNGRKIRESLITSIGIFVGFIFMTFLAGVVTPICTVHPVIGTTILYMNILVSFSLAVSFMMFFTHNIMKATGSLKTQNSELEVSANVDTLTGLRNRRSIEEYMTNAYDKARGEGVDFSVLMCDIDNFKHVNDTYGHECGDLVLKNIAKQISEALRPEDVVFRWGGEEILIMIAGGRFPAMKVAERCRQAVEGSEVVYKDIVVKVTITIGGACYYQGATPEALLGKADENLYKGKNNGKNQVVM